MSFSISIGPRKEWEITDMCQLQRTQQGNAKRPFSHSIHRSGPRYTGREQILLFPGWLQWLQPNSDCP